MQQNAGSIPQADVATPAQGNVPCIRLHNPSPEWTESLWRQLRLPAALILCGFCALVVDVPLAHAVFNEKVLAKLDHFLETVEPFGHAFAVALIVIGIGVCDPTKRWAIPRLLAGSLGAGVAADLIKLTIKRVRPYHFDFKGNALDTFLGVFPGTRAGSHFQSCPSAHVAVAVGLAVGLGTLFPRGRRYFALLAGLVALQRIATGAHFLSDTLWGAATGYLFTLLIFRHDLLGRVFDNLERNLMMKYSDDLNLTSNAAIAPGVIAGGSQPRVARQEARIAAEQTPIASIRKLSIVVPVFNERENVGPLFEAVQYTLSPLEIPYEILFVDDGSNDGTGAELSELACHAATVKVVTLRKNFGQTAALRAGIEHSSGDVIVTLDGDMQNDPADIPMMLHKLCEGYDLVHGWRKERQDRFLDRRLPSLIANWLISRVTGCPFHDLGCTLKVMRRHVATELELSGELHRFIPVLARSRGARCAEVVTRHHPRRHGLSKANILRTPRVIIDLITVKFLTQYLASPMRVFGSVGLASLTAGLVGVAACAAAILYGVETPLVATLLCGAACVGALGLQLIGLGLLGEILTRNYYEFSGKTPYAVRSLTNFDDAEPAIEVARSFAA